MTVRIHRRGYGKRKTKWDSALQKADFFNANRDPAQWFCMVCDGDGFARVFGIGTTEAEAFADADKTIRQYEIESLDSWTFRISPPSDPSDL